ncbi:hypothetical protein Tco_1431448 [Tanacetum coccineum]
MLCYLTGMEPYYIQCIKDGPFKPKTVEGADKPEAQWTPNERMVVNQDQCLKSIIISCLPDDIIESIISCDTGKATWTDLVYSFEGPSNTKENRIMDLKLEYQTFKAKSFKTLSQTYTYYKTLLNELANDGVTLSKHKINAGFVNSLLDKWLSFLKYLEMQITLRPLSLLIFMEEFSKKIDDEADERSSEEYLRDLDIEFHERALLANSKCFIKRKNNCLSQKANEDTECYKCGKKGHFQEIDFLKLLPTCSKQSGEPNVQKDYKAKYKKMKAKMALLEACPPTY